MHKIFTNLKMFS